MIKAKYADKHRITVLLSRAFQHNPSVIYTVKRGKSRADAVIALMDYAFEVCYLFGEIWLSDQREACALILYPHQKRTSWRSVWLDLQLMRKGIGFRGVARVLKRESEIKNIHPDIPQAYVWFIGVEPALQHRGMGSKLLTTVLADANEKGLPVFLETSVVENLPWYRRFGFEVYDELVLDYTLFFLKHLPN